MSNTLYLIDEDPTATHPTVTPVARLLESHKEFNEAWVRDLLYKNPQLLPVQQLKPDAREFLPIAVEVPFPDVGKADLVGVTTGGYPVIVETKLWRNPDARRKVMAQLIDYIKEMAKQDYEWFEKLWREHHPKSANPNLFKAASDASTIELDETEFADRIGHACQVGDVLGFIVGDGIKHGLLKLVSYLAKHSSHLRYSMTLLELRCHKLPTGSLAVIPNIVQEVSPVERGHYRIEMPPELAGQIKLSSVAESPPSDQAPRRKPNLTEDEFWRKLELIVGANYTERIKAFVSDIEERAVLDLDPDKRSLIFKIYPRDMPEKTLNIFSIRPDGRALGYRDGPEKATESWGVPHSQSCELFEEYGKQLNKISTHFKVGSMMQSSTPVPIDEYIDHLDDIADAIQSISTNLRAAASEQSS